MANFCVKCGNPLNPDSKFCSKCGTPVAAAAKKVPPKYEATETKKTPPKYETPETKKPEVKREVKKEPVKKETVNKEPKPKKKGGGFGKFICLVLVACLLFTGFVKPGFILKIIKPEEPPRRNEPVVVNPVIQPDEDEPVKPKDDGKKNEPVADPEEFKGNSKELAYSPYKGFYVTAKKDAFMEDTVVEISHLDSSSREVYDAAVNLYDEGYFVVDGFEVNAGLESDETMPGEYTVTVDLSALDIDPELYEAIRVFRVADDGTYYEYATEIEDGKLTYTSNQNSAIFWAIFIPIVIAIAGGMYRAEGNAPYQYFYNGKKKTYDVERKTEYGKYKLTWAMEDIGINVDEVTKRVEEIARDYASRSDQIYKQYKEDLLFEQGSILGIFATGKSQAQVLKEAVESDPEYSKLSKQLEVPDVVEYTCKCIEEALKYLAKEEGVKMPKGVIEIVSRPGLGALAYATARVAHESYVEINMSQVKDGDQKKKNDFLMTITHELLHVCQQNYRYFHADTIKYDEMVAVFMEERALNHYEAVGLIDYANEPDLSPYAFWSTLKLPLDMYLYLGSESDGECMKNEGYNLGVFLKYVYDKVGKYSDVGRMMNARCSYAKTDVAAPLTRIFGISYEELDIHYQNFMRIHKKEISAHYNGKPGPGDAFQRNEEIMISKGEKHHIPLLSLTGYLTEIRGFQQTSTEPMNLILVPDENFASEHPEIKIVPIDDYQLFSKGAFLPAPSNDELLQSGRHRNIMEVHGYVLVNIAATANYSTAGYTIYVLDQTKMPNVFREDDEMIVLKMPENSYVADDKIISGYILTVSSDEYGKKEFEVGPDFFEGEFTVSKADILGVKPTDKNYEERIKEEVTLTLTLCEYIQNGENKIMGEESEEVYYTINQDKGFGLSAFTGAWIPTSYDKVDADSYIIGLIYVDDMNEFGYFESQAQYWNVKGRWSEIKEFDYNELTGILTINFDNGPATFEILNNGHMIMSNYGGSWEFYKSE